MYIPPYKITDKMMRLLSEISEQVGIITTQLGESVPSPREAGVGSSFQPQEEKEEGNGLHDKLHDKFPELSDKAVEILGILKAHPSLNASEMGGKTGLSLRQVRTHLGTLKKAGLIVRVGSNKTGYWKVTLDTE